MGDLWDALGDLLLVLWDLLYGIAAAVAPALWGLLVNHREARITLAAGVGAFVLVWFIHGAFFKEWKPCRFCSGKGRFFAKWIFRKTFTLCNECGGSGRRLRIPARLWAHWRGHNS